MGSRTLWSPNIRYRFNGLLIFIQFFFCQHQLHTHCILNWNWCIAHNHVHARTSQARSHAPTHTMLSRYRSFILLIFFFWIWVYMVQWNVWHSTYKCHTTSFNGSKQMFLNAILSHFDWYWMFRHMTRNERKKEKKIAWMLSIQNIFKPLILTFYTCCFFFILIVIRYPTVGVWGRTATARMKLAEVTPIQYIVKIE